MRELIDVEMLRALRTARSLSQGALAALAGVDRTVVARLERGGQKDVRLSVLLGLASALHVSIEKLVLMPHTADSPAAPHLSQDLAAAVAALDSLTPETQHRIAAIIHAYLTTLPSREVPSPPLQA